MRPLRYGIFAAMLLPLLSVGVTPGSAAPGSAAQAPGLSAGPAQAHQFQSARRHHRRHHHRRHHRAAAVRTTTARPQRFDRRTVRTIRGLNKITVTWPARANATGYTVTWSPLISRIPSSPASCAYPCKHIFTRGTSVTLSAAQLTTAGRRVSSASGDSTHFKVFSHNGAALNWTGVTYPYDSWISPAKTAAVDWVPSMSAQMPLPYAPAAGRDVAVTSFNVLAASGGGPSWTSRAPHIVSQINNTGASIVATQENSNSNSGVGSSNNQYTDLANRLRPSGWALADSRNWDTARGMSRSWSTQGTRTYYKTSVWNQTANGALLTHVPISGQTTGVNVDRWVSWTKLRADADASTQLCVIDAHLLTNLGGNVTAAADHRRREVAQILSELNDPNSTVARVGTRVGQACAGVPTVFAGDLNSFQEQAYGNEPQYLMLGSGFLDTKNATHRYNTRMSGPGTVTAWHETWGTQIDYLLTKGMGGAKSFKVNSGAPSTTGSDHYPITAVVSVPSS